MLKEQFIALLRCPETRARLSAAEPGLVARLNLAIAAGTLKNKAGQPVSKSLDGGLIREDGAVVYPIQNDIPILLTDEGIVLAGEMKVAPI